VVAGYFVERVAKVDLQEAVLGILELAQSIAKGVSDDLDSSFASHTVVAAKAFSISSLPPTQKHFATNLRMGSPQARGRTAVADFSSAIDTPPATKGLRKLGAVPAAKSFTACERASLKE